MYREQIGDPPPEFKRNREDEPTQEAADVEEVQIVIESRMTKLEGKSRLSELLFPSLSELDFSNVDSRQATEMIRKACKGIEIIDETDQVIDQSPSVTNLLRTVPTPHMFIRLNNGQRILVVPKDVDLVLIYHPVSSGEKRTKGAWVCGNVITL